ncbi:hypothetical protein [Streptomyces sp. D2-8]|uniref:hypothetical protein n=1 Tax=Streptomyces sp. D2-8 TaxID=2707767 RepID=UPI0020C185A4|nr:hypothetical protein [Streptomyces sp. D2-8]
MTAETRTSSRRKTALTWINALAAVAVTVTLAVNLLRGWPMLSPAATLLIAGGLYVRWTRAGRRHRERRGTRRGGLTPWSASATR